MEIMIVFISIYNVNDNLLYLIFHGYCYDIFHICHKNWKIRENDTERYFILDLNAIPMLKYRSLKKIDWAGQALTCSLDSLRIAVIFVC